MLCCFVGCLRLILVVGVLFRFRSLCCLVVGWALDFSGGLSTA